MATFLPGVTDAVTPPQLYHPDYAFLTQVMGTAQARYDQGFNQVKSVYNSAMNLPISNADNENYRQDVFKKLDTQLRSVSGVDLGNQSNVLKAQGLFDPIINDQELRYDMVVTQHLNKQLDTAERMSNSPDPKIRAQYSDIAKQDVLFAQDDLRKAKRGDGSIFRAEKRDFVPFEDVMAFYGEQAKAQGLKIEKDIVNNGYKLKRINGGLVYDKSGKVIDQGVVPEFANWAKTVAGNRFDRQFQVEGRVAVESQIRQRMSEVPGMSKEQAVQELAAKLSAPTLDHHARAGLKAQEGVSDIDEQITRFKQAHPNGVPEALAQKYQNLLDKRAEQESTAREAETTLHALSGEKGLKYLTNNLYNFAAEQAKTKSATQWASAYAAATSSQEISSDEAFWAGARLKQDDRHFQQNFALETAKYKTDVWYKGQQIGLTTRGQDITARGQDIQKMIADGRLTQDQAELELKKLAAVAKGDKSAEELIGTYTASGQNKTATDMFTQQNETARVSLYNAAFGNDPDGLLYHAVSNPAQRNQFASVISQLRRISTGQQSSLRPQDEKILQMMGQTLRLGTLDVPKNRAVADAVLHDLTEGVYKAAARNIDNDVSGQKTSSSRPVLSAAKRVLVQVDELQHREERLSRKQRELSKEITDSNGNIKPQYAGARVVSYNSDNTPIYDYSGVSIERKQQLDAMVPSEFHNQTHVSGSSYTFKNPPSALIAAGLSPSILSSVKVDGKDVTSDYRAGKSVSDAVTAFRALNPAEQLKAIGSSAIGSFDPVSQELHLNLKLGSSSQKALKDQEMNLEVSIPYQRILSNPDLKKHYGEYVQRNMIDSNPLGVANQLRKNKHGVVRESSLEKSFGVQYQITTQPNSKGQPSVGITWTFKDPSGWGEDRVTHESLAVNVDDLDAAHIIDAHIQNGRDAYLDRVEAYEKLTKTQQKTIPFSNFNAR